jgi:hypothetical protein
VRDYGRCPARTGDLLLVRREHVQRSAAVYRSGRSVSDLPHAAAALCTTSRRASRSARRRAATSDTAGVRRFVGATPSTTATAASVRASNTTQRPCMRGSPRMLSDRRVCGRGRRHHEQLALSHREMSAGRIGLRVEPGSERRLERGGSICNAQPPRDLVGVEQREIVHRRTNPVPSVSRESSRKRCSPVRKAVPETSVRTPSATSPIARSRSRPAPPARRSLPLAP